MARGSDSWFHPPYGYLLLFGAAFAIFGQSLGFTLGKLDEYNIIAVNLDLLRDPSNIGSVLLTNPFFNKGGDFYRPMQNLSFMADTLAGGGSAWAYYLTAILLHGTAASLLYTLLSLTGRNRKIAFLLSLIFLAHPLFVQTVAWAPSRGDQLMTVFGLLSVIAWIRYYRTERSLFLYLHVVSFALALFSKEPGILLPVACAGWVFLLGGKHTKPSRFYFLPVILWASVIVLFFYLRNHVVGVETEGIRSGIIALTDNLRTVPELLFKFFIPIGLAPMPAYSITATLGGIAALILLFVISVRVRPATVRELAFGLGWFILFLAPSLLFVNPNGRTAFDYLEHRAYLPAVGILIFISGWIDRHDQLQLARKAPVLLSLVAFLFGIYSFSYAKKYKDPVVYFNMAVEGNPGSAVALYCRGTVLFYENKDYRSAIYDFDRVLDLSPGYAQAYLNRGFCKEQTGDIAGAIKDYKSAFKADSTTYEPLAALAFLYTSQGADSLALPLYSYAITVNPEFAVGYFQRALIKMRLQDLNGAREDLDHAIASDRDYAEAYLYRGTVMHMLKDPGQALSDFDQAISMDATLVAAYVNRGVLKFETGDQEGALADLDQAVNLDNRSTDAFLNRGRVLYFLGRKEAAKADWLRAAGLGSEEAQKLLSII